MEATTLTARRSGRREGARAASARTWIAGAALAGLVAGSLLVAVAAAQGGSPAYLSPSVRPGVPGWLAWPLGGLWPGRTDSQSSIQWALLVVLLAMHACYGVALWLARSLRPALVWAAVGGAYGAFFLAPPVLFTDLFNYIGYARMGALHGLGAYSALPVDAPHDLVYRLSTWHHLPNPYGPLFTLLLYALVPLGVAGAYWTLKALLLAAAAGALLLVARIARRVGVPPARAVVLVGLNPIVLVYGAGGQHMDMLLLIPLLGAVDLALARHEAAAGAAMAAAAALKASAAAAVLVLVAGSRDRGRALAGAAGASVALGLVSLAVFGPNLPDLSAQTRSVTPFSVPNVIGMIAGRGGADAPLRTVMEVLFGLATLACMVRAWRTREILAPLGWLAVATIATLSWDMPWYILWLLPFVAFVRTRAFRIAAIALCAWVTIQWLPQFPAGMHRLGFNPSRTATWHANSLYEKRLVR